MAVEVVMRNMVIREGLEDFSTKPKELRKLIEAGRCDAVVNFHSILQPDGTYKLGMIAAGMTQQDIFDAACVIRRTMMMMLNLTEREPIAEAIDDGLVADDEPVPPAGACETCGRAHWTVLAKCDRMGCPKGLYSP